MKIIAWLVLVLVLGFLLFSLVPRKAINQKNTEKVSAIIETERGNIALELDPQLAPKTVANFSEKAKAGFYNGLTFHRVEDWVVQGGDPKGDGTGGGEIPTELNSKQFLAGSLGVARGGDIKVSNDAQFFIVKRDADWLNNKYTYFGHVVSGMDVVNSLAIGDRIIAVSIK